MESNDAVITNEVVKKLAEALDMTDDELSENTGRSISELNAMTELRFETEGIIWMPINDYTEVAILGTTERKAQLEIRSMYCWLPVTEISDRAFEGDDVLEGIKLPSTVKHVGKHAFWGCSKLRKIQ